MFINETRSPERPQETAVQASRYSLRTAAGRPSAFSPLQYTNKHWASDNEKPYSIFEHIAVCWLLAPRFSHMKEQIHLSARKDSSFFFIYGEVSAYCMNCTGTRYSSHYRWTRYPSVNLRFSIFEFLGTGCDRIRNKPAGSESVTFWYGSGSVSSDPYLWLTSLAPDPDPALFVCTLQDANKNKFFLSKFLCLFLFEGTFASFFNRID